MRRIVKLQLQKTKLVEQLQAINVKADLETDGVLTAEQETAYKALEAQVATLNDAIARQARLDADDLAAPAVERWPANGERPWGGELFTQRPPVGRARGRRYAEMFGAPQRDPGFTDFNEFLRVVHSGTHHPALQASHFEHTGAAGGFSVPDQFVMELLDKSLENEIVRPRATIEPMTSDKKRIAGWDMSDSSASAPGGFSVQWGIDEGGAVSLKTGKLKMLTLEARKVGLLAEASNELVADSPVFEDQLSTAIVAAMGWGLDLAFFTGSGAGQPRGILNDPALIVVAKETGQLPGTIVYENLTTIFSRMQPACHRNSVWVANSTAIPQLLSIVIGVGTGGVHFPVLQQDGGRFFIFGREVLFTEKLPAVGAQGDIGLYDLSQYAVGLRKEVALDRSSHVGFTRDMETYRALMRVDGQGRWNQAYKPKNGSTLSWAVTLAARA